MKRVFASFLVSAVTLAAPAFAQLTLSGMTVWDTRDANGTWIGGINYYYFNTLGSDAAGDTVANVYVFTGSIGAPVYRNSADTNAQLNPNLSLALGANVIYFACNTTPAGVAGSSSFGINLFFDGDITHNRISAMVPNDGGSSSFSVISGATNTYGETAINGAPIAGSDALSYSAGGYTATLSNFYVLAPGDSPNLVGYFALTPALDSPDTVGSMTLTVTAIPEPSTYAALAGLGVLGLAAWRRRPKVVQRGLTAAKMVAPGAILPCLGVALALTWAPLARAQLFVDSVNTNQVLKYDATTGAFMGVFASTGGGGFNYPTGLVFGSDGNLYVAGRDSNQVFRYDGTSGTLVGGGAFTSGTATVAPFAILFGPDGKLYVGAHWAEAPGAENVVRRYNGTTGVFINTSVADGSGGLEDPRGMVFGPDGNLYVSSCTTDNVLRYDGTSGAFMGVFASGAGLDAPHGLVFGSDGNLYVSSFYSNSVLRFDGSTGASMGAFVSGGSGGLSGPVGLLFGPDNNLYVSSSGSDAILRYNGSSGVFIDAFVTNSPGGLDAPTYMTFVGTSPTTLAFVPEPSTYAALAGLAALGFAAWRKRRRQ